MYDSTLTVYLVLKSPMGSFLVNLFQHRVENICPFLLQIPKFVEVPLCLRTVLHIAVHPVSDIHEYLRVGADGILRKLFDLSSSCFVKHSLADIGFQFVRSPSPSLIPFALASNVMLVDLFQSFDNSFLKFISSAFPIQHVSNVEVCPALCHFR